MTNRRSFIKQGSLLGAAGLLSPSASRVAPETKKDPSAKVFNKFWPDGSRLMVSLSMQFEAGGQPDNPDSPFPQNMKPGFKDLPALTWYEYGYKEGIPRMLDNWDKLGVKVTSHMVGAAVLKNPSLAKEIVARGHEASAHGMSWSDQYAMAYEEEKKFIQDGADAIKKTTGVTAVGYNANWLRRSENTLRILQELNFLYHIDDVSRDEPFVIKIDTKDFVVIPYTLRCNDIVLMESKNFSADQFMQQVKLEFEQMYEESAQRRRLLSIAFHDRIGGTPQMVKVATELISYIKKQPGVSFKRKDEIAKMVLYDRNTVHE